MHKKDFAWSLHQCLKIKDLKAHIQKNLKKFQYTSKGHKSRVHCLIRGGNISTGDHKSRQRNPPKEILLWVKDRFSNW